MILDTNCFGRFFDKDNIEHDEFIPALKWVIEGDGRLMYGGTKYLSELANAKKYIKFFSELSRAGKTIILDSNLVDAEEKKAREMEPDSDFDDPHLVALVIVGKCRIICSADKRSIKYLLKSASNIDSGKMCNSCTPRVCKDICFAHISTFSLT